MQTCSTYVEDNITVHIPHGAERSDHSILDPQNPPIRQWSSVRYRFSEDVCARYSVYDWRRPSHTTSRLMDKPSDTIHQSTRVSIFMWADIEPTGIRSSKCWLMRPTHGHTSQMKPIRSIWRSVDDRRSRYSTKPQRPCQILIIFHFVKLPHTCRHTPSTLCDVT